MPPFIPGTQTVPPALYDGPLQYPQTPFICSGLTHNSPQLPFALTSYLVVPIQSILINVPYAGHPDGEGVGDTDGVHDVELKLVISDV